mmetsp:Transcript_19536/g.45954  ORF Transcript_19536/g.45954 Transcript_19536/m.45954 type:complete len:203 (-) Transcript_19536:98-706(-)
MRRATSRCCQSTAAFFTRRSPSVTRWNGPPGRRWRSYMTRLVTFSSCMPPTNRRARMPPSRAATRSSRRVGTSSARSSPRRWSSRPSSTTRARPSGGAWHLAPLHAAMRSSPTRAATAITASSTRRARPSTTSFRSYHRHRLAMASSRRERRRRRRAPACRCLPPPPPPPSWSLSSAGTWVPGVAHGFRMALRWSSHDGCRN